VWETVGFGYAGEIRAIIALDPDGKILGTRVLSHKETPGLGDKIEAAKTDWILKFTGLSLGNPAEDQWKVKKDGGQFDQFSGATITPRAVVKSLHEALQFFEAHKGEMLEVKPWVQTTNALPATGCGTTMWCSRKAWHFARRWL
jgi:electron transport complex protein RnfG